jgi:hypothetical protein
MHGVTDTEARAGAVAALAQALYEAESDPVVWSRTSTDAYREKADQTLDAILANPDHRRALLAVLLDPDAVAMALRKRALLNGSWDGHEDEAATELIAALTEDQGHD